MFNFFRKNPDPQNCDHEYEYVYHTARSCRQKRHCIHCGHNLPSARTIAHQWSQWQLAPDRCELVRRCERCEGEERRVAHHWQGWKPAARSCREQRQCALCGLTETKTEHQWGDWSFIKADSCQQRRFCQQCGRIEHKGTKYLRCPRCQHICLSHKRQYNPRPIGPMNLATAAKSDLDWEYRHWPLYKYWYECDHCHLKLTEEEYEARTNNQS